MAQAEPQAAVPDAPPLDCPECGGTMRLKPSRYGLFFGCSNFPQCRATHGAHPDGRPLGTPAKLETKRARMAAHEIFDGLWMGALAMYDLDHPSKPSRDRKRTRRKILRVARRRAYDWLAERLGLPDDECHIGSFDLETCRRVVALCDGVTPHEVRWWAQNKREAGQAETGRVAEKRR